MSLNPAQISIAAIISYVLSLIALRFFIPICLSTSMRPVSESLKRFLSTSKFIAVSCACNVLMSLIVAICTLNTASICSTQLIISWDMNIIDSIVFIACSLSLSLLYVLSVIDAIFFFVPNVLLLGLLACSLVVYYLRPSGVHIFYPFALLGICYACYFALHAFVSTKMGEGDILVFSSLGILLDSFFNALEMPALLLMLASLLALIFAAIRAFLKGKWNWNERIALIPFLNMAFLLLCIKEIYDLGQIC